MKLRAKIILTAASLALSCALLAGCGGSLRWSLPLLAAASSEPASTVLSQLPPASRWARTTAPMP